MPFKSDSLLSGVSVDLTGLQNKQPNSPKKRPRIQTVHFREGLRMSVDLELIQALKERT